MFRVHERKRDRAAALLADHHVYVNEFLDNVSYVLTNKFVREMADNLFEGETPLGLAIPKHRLRERVHREQRHGLGRYQDTHPAVVDHMGILGAEFQFVGSHS
jgi:hypothetical protein